MTVPWVKRAWSIIEETAFERPEPPAELDEWLHAPAQPGQGGSLPSNASVGAMREVPGGDGGERTSYAVGMPPGRGFGAEISDLKSVIGERVLETSAGRWVRDSWSQIAREKASLIDKGSERCRSFARVSVADVATKLLPKLEGFKADCDTCSDSEAVANGWGGHMKGYVKSVIHEKSKEAIYGACRRAGLDPEKLQDEGYTGSPAGDVHAVPPDKYITNRTIRDALAGGDVVLIRGSWLLKRCSGCTGLPSRKELETRFPNAVWKVDELMELAETGAVALIAVSYCWCTEEHPDPEGEQMQVLRETLQHFLGSTALEDVALFIDWCSLHQSPRSADEEGSFTRALQDIHLWYVHQGIRVWMLTSVPAGAGLGTQYADRGWPTLERSLSEMVTKSSFLLDLGLLNNSCTSWQQIIAACKPERRPPLTPEAFAEELSTKVFSAGLADHELVLQRYAHAFFEVIIAAEELAFNELGWADEEAKTLALALSRCRRLRKITLYGNRIGEEGAMALLQVLSQVHSLEEFWLTNNPAGKNKDSKARLADAWAQAGRTDDSLHV